MKSRGKTKSKENIIADENLCEAIAKARAKSAVRAHEIGRSMRSVSKIGVY